ncbi:MAG TPA: type IV pilin protein [Longimicrobiaceae bacterium]|nr:type IV pilin protein [Longimicrobiaceae bacterium]
MTRRATLLAAALLLGACGNPRNDAISELERLHEAMQRHAATHGRYPQTLDASLPASPANLPHAPRKEAVSLHLGGVTRDGYLATARRSPWTCWLRVSGGQAAPPDCVPTSNADTPAGAPQRPKALDDALQSPDTPRAP